MAKARARSKRCQPTSGASCRRWPSGTAAEHVFERHLRRLKGRKDRPPLDVMLKGIACRDFDMVAARSVDRLGRSLPDLIEVLRDLHAKGVDLYLHQQGLNTSTPSGGRCTR
jgi:DNA invertase Pin-like site-specific DNA recombinase